MDIRGFTGTAPFNFFINCGVRFIGKGFRFTTDKMYRKKIIFNKKTMYGLYDRMPDKEFIKRMYYYNTGKKLNLKDPKTFNEKIQWLKLYDRKKEYILLTDKYEVKKIVGSKIGEQYIVPLIGVWDQFDEIDFERLPEQFVLKCTHDCGGLFICKDKKSMDIRKAEKKITDSLRRNYFYTGREWPYKYVTPRIIAEKYMVDESGTELKDYKFFCFSGEPKIIEVDFGRFTDHKRNLYTTDWKPVHAEIMYESDLKRNIPKPGRLEEMLGLARVLSAGYPHVRVDFYCVSGEIYFGEMTFYHGSGIEEFRPERFGKVMGKWLELPQ